MYFQLNVETMPHAGQIDDLIFLLHTWRCLTGTCHGILHYFCLTFCSKPADFFLVPWQQHEKIKGGGGGCGGGGCASGRGGGGGGRGGGGRRLLAFCVWCMLGFARDEGGRQVWAAALESRYPRKMCVALASSRSFPRLLPWWQAPVQLQSLWCEICLKFHALSEVQAAKQCCPLH